jgi:spermidine/putrescine transport system permease protein
MSAAARTPRVRLSGHAALSVLTTLMFVYLYAPIVVMVLLAFNDSDLAVLPLQGVTLRWFAKIFRDEHLMEGLRNSIMVAVVAVAIAVPLGLILSYALVRTARGRAAAALGAVVSAPMQTPKIVLATLLLLLFSLAGIRPSLVTVTLSHVVLILPFVTLIIAARLRGIDPSMEEAAADLGASALRTWLSVLLPLLAPAVVAATLIAFTISFDEMVVSYFTIGTESTLPVVIWSMVSYGYSQEINAIGAVIIGTTLVLIAAAQVLQRNQRL